MKVTAMRNTAYVVSALGVALHVYLTCIQPATGSLYYLIVPLMNVIPYLACVIIAWTITRPIMPLCASLIILLLDLYLFQGYLSFERTYRFAVLEVYQILFKTIVILPCGCLIGFMIDKLFIHSAIKRDD
jgi:hypothetical protein